MKFFLPYYRDESIDKKTPKLPEKLEKWQKKFISKREKGFYCKNNQQFGQSNNTNNALLDTLNMIVSYVSQIWYCGQFGPKS